MRSIFARLEGHARERPDAPAFVGPGGTLGYAALHRGALAAARWLDAGGARAGDTVALSLDEDPEGALRSLYFTYGIAYLGCALLPLYPDVPPAARAGLLGRYGARWMVAATVAGAPGATRLVDARGFDPAEVLGEPPPRGDDPDRPCVFHFTSGTTGVPKACLFTFGQWAERLLHASTSLGSSHADRMVAARRWPGLPGLRALLGTHATGGAFVNAAAPGSHAELASLVRELGVTELMLSPFQLRVLLRNTSPHDAGTVQLRMLSVGGGIVSPAEVEAVRSTITPNLYLDYGSNETGRIALLRPGDPADRFGRVGRIVAGVEAQVVDRQGRPLAAGEEGLLRFRTPWLTPGYAANPEASAERFIDGWFQPGDTGSIDAEGGLTLGGRSDDVINFGGLKLVPAEIEAVLMQHPHIVDAALVGVPDPMSGQVPVAFLVVRRDVQAAEVQQFCRERMEASRAPFLYESVTEIPRNAAGKALREKLREIYAVRAATRR